MSLIKVGDKGKIINNITEHGFDIGEVVTVMHVINHLNIVTLVCKHGNKSYGIRAEEIEIIWEV